MPSKFAREYRLLGVADYAPIAEIKKQQRAMTARLHPDRVIDDEVKAAANARELAEINAAADVLRDGPANAERRAHSARQRKGRAERGPLDPTPPPPPASANAGRANRVPDLERQVVLASHAPSSALARPTALTTITPTKRADGPGWGTLLGAAALLLGGYKVATMNRRDENGHLHDRKTGRFTNSR